MTIKVEAGQKNKLDMYNSEVENIITKIAAQLVEC